jgi:hypothetical protein
MIHDAKKPKNGQMDWQLLSKSHPQLVGWGSPGHASPIVHHRLKVPEPALDHLVRLTDDTGLLQHARYTIPNRAHGYCTDDNARGAIAMVRHYARSGDPQTLKLLDVYLSFLMYAQDSDGSIRNFMDFNRNWWEEEPAHDGFGRSLWAWGAVLAASPSPAYASAAKDCFDRSVEHVPRQSLRGLAYCIFGLCDYLRRFPDAGKIKRHIERAADTLVAQYQETRSADWDWFEDILTYDNPVLSHALFAAGTALGNDRYVEMAARTASFLLETTFHGGHFSFVGCAGWYERGKTRAAFDQQPLEAAAMVMMLRAAYDATKNARFLHLQRTAFDWFLGANDLRVPLYDFHTKGCSDGLMPDGVNGNQGAESMVSFLLSLLSIVESREILDRVWGIPNAAYGPASGRTRIESPAAPSLLDAMPADAGYLPTTVEQTDGMESPLTEPADDPS